MRCPLQERFNADATNQLSYWHRIRYTPSLFYRFAVVYETIPLIVDTWRNTGIFCSKLWLQLAASPTILHKVTFRAVKLFAKFATGCPALPRIWMTPGFGFRNSPSYMMPLKILHTPSTGEKISHQISVNTKWHWQRKFLPIMNSLTSEILAIFAQALSPIHGKSPQLWTPDENHKNYRAVRILIWWMNKDMRVWWWNQLSQNPEQSTTLNF